ncbi:MAG: hypothetical protein EVB11_05090 [Winogradskyella sp.]|nr:MAG: hypothetical protein EVB11_05090 [Winogradskyella sp.]
MSRIENIKSFFQQNESNEATGKAPKGVCPNCWGAQEWENEYYKFKKGNNGNYDNNTYDTFIMKVARMLGKIASEGNQYVCETCRMKFEKLPV